jgi:hypothetical protein
MNDNSQAFKSLLSRICLGVFPSVDFRVIQWLTVRAQNQWERDIRQGAVQKGPALVFSLLWISVWFCG